MISIAARLIRCGFQDAHDVVGTYVHGVDTLYVLHPHRMTHAEFSANTGLGEQVRSVRCVTVEGFRRAMVEPLSATERSVLLEAFSSFAEGDDSSADDQEDF